MEYLQDLFFQLNSIITSFKEHEILATITFFLKENGICNASTAMVCSTIFNFLLNSYTSFISKHSDLAEKYEGYMVKTIADINRYTSSDVNPTRTALKKLSDAGLIEYKKGNINNATRIRITELAVQTFYDNYYIFIQYRDEGKYEADKKRENQKEKRKENYRKYLESQKESNKKSEGKDKVTDSNTYNGYLDFNKVNEAQFDKEAIGEVFKVIADDNKRIASCYLVYLFSYYYKLYTGNAYEWDYLKYSILIEAFKDYYKYDNKEICISLTLRKVLNIKETDLGGKRKKEITFAEKYNHDYNYHHLNNLAADRDGYQGYKFDNILGLEEYYPSYYYEEHKPSYVGAYSNPERLALFD